MRCVTPPTQIAFWVVTVLGMASLYFNIQHQKGSSSGLNEHGLVGQGAPYGRNLQRVPGNNVGLIDGGIAATTGVEMGKIGSKRGSRKSSSRRKGSSSKSGGYAKVNGDADWDGGDGGATVYGMDSEEEVDLGLVSSCWHIRAIFVGRSPILFHTPSFFLLGKRVRMKCCCKLYLIESDRVLSPRRPLSILRLLRSRSTSSSLLYLLARMRQLTTRK